MLLALRRAARRWAVAAYAHICPVQCEQAAALLPPGSMALASAPGGYTDRAPSRTHPAPLVWTSHLAPFPVLFDTALLDALSWQRAPSNPTRKWLACQ